MQDEKDGRQTTEFLNALGETLTVQQMRLRTDAACKRLLADKQILAWLLQSCAREYRGCTIPEIIACIENDPEVATAALEQDDRAAGRIAGMANEDVSLTEGLVRFDLRFYARIPGAVRPMPMELIVNVEAQNAFRPGYSLSTRGVYYAARMIAAQKEVDFLRSNYQDLKKVYSIWICMNPPREWEGTIASFGICQNNIVGHMCDLLENYDKMQVVLVCLGGRRDPAVPTALLDMLETLFSQQISPRQKMDALLADFNIKTTVTIRKELEEMCNYSEGIWNDGLQKGRREGRQEGRREGRREGRQEGRREERIAAARGIMKSLSVTAEKALELLQIPMDDRKELLALLNG